MLKRRFAWVIAIPVALMSATPFAVASVPASAATSAPTAPAIFNAHQVKSVQSGKCLTNGGSTANSAPITQFTCNGNANQAWTYNSSTLVFANNSGMCLTDGGSTANSAPITQFACNGSQNQEWLLFIESDGSSEGIENAHTGKCMTNGGSKANSAPITQFTCASNDSDRNQWFTG
jgi:hypothetical protein